MYVSMCVSFLLDSNVVLADDVQGRGVAQMNLLVCLLHRNASMCACVLRPYFIVFWSASKY